MDTLTDRQRAVLKVLAKASGTISLDTIASRLGYRPARTGRLAVAGTCRALLKVGYRRGGYGEEGDFVIRLPPRNQWDCAKWGATDKTRKLFSCG